MLKNATSLTNVSHDDGGGRRLDHHAERHVATKLDAARLERARRLVEHLARESHLVERDDERQHDADVAMHRRAQQRAQLHAEQLRLIETHPDRAPAEERIRLRGKSADRQLVAADDRTCE